MRDRQPDKDGVIPACVDHPPRRRVISYSQGMSPWRRFLLDSPPILRDEDSPWARFLREGGSVTLPASSAWTRFLRETRWERTDPDSPWQQFLRERGANLRR